MSENRYFIYIMSNQSNTVLYIGMTNNLPERIRAHKEKRGSQFTIKYNIEKLLYFEEYNHPDDAIAREKQLKNYSRQKKEELITRFNLERNDLFNEVALW